MQNVNRVILTGNLTRDPEMRDTQSGTSICQLRLAVNGRMKQGGDWLDKPNFFDVVCFGSTADNVSRYLKKGAPVAVDGRLDWREWQSQDGSKRQAVQVIAETIQFLSSGDGAASGRSESASAPPTSTYRPDDDDIPF